MLPSTRVSVISIFVQLAHKMHFIFSLNTTDPINFITLKKTYCIYSIFVWAGLGCPFLCHRIIWHRTALVWSTRIL